MTPNAILNADMATLNRWAQSGWSWWIDELRGLLPMRLSGGNRRFETLAQPLAGGGFALSRRGTVIARQDRQPIAAAVALPAEAALRRELRLPALPGTELAKLVALDLDRLMPFPPGSALVAVEPGPRDSTGRQAVAIAAMPIARAQAIMDAAEADRIDIRRIGCLDEHGQLRFDFLPSLRSLGGSVAGQPARRWWGLVGLLAVLNLILLIAIDVRSTAAMAELVAANGEAAATAQRLRVRVTGEAAKRRAQLYRRSAVAPLPLLSELTRVLPDTVWVQRLAWDGSKLRLIGYKRGDADPVAALRQLPRFAQVRASTAEVAARQAVGEPFDVTATAVTSNVGAGR